MLKPHVTIRPVAAGMAYGVEVAGTWTEFAFAFAWPPFSGKWCANLKLILDVKRRKVC